MSKVTAVKAKTKPKYSATTAKLLEAARAFYKEAENEEAFQAWKAEQKKKGA